MSFHRDSSFLPLRDQKIWSNRVRRPSTLRLPPVQVPLEKEKTRSPWSLSPSDLPVPGAASTPYPEYPPSLDSPAYSCDSGYSTVVSTPETAASESESKFTFSHSSPPGFEPLELDLQQVQWPDSNEVDPSLDNLFLENELHAEWERHMQAKYCSSKENLEQGAFGISNQEQDEQVQIHEAAQRILSKLLAQQNRSTVPDTIEFAPFKLTPPNPEGIQYVGADVVFWVEQHPKLYNYEVIISGPYGRMESSSFLNLNLGQFRHSFKPLMPGRYTVQVAQVRRTENDWPTPTSVEEAVEFAIEPEFQHLTGSPFEVVVRKNYELASHHSIVNMDMELESYVYDVYMDPPEVRLEKELVVFRKPWGMAVNHGTQQIYVTDREQHQILTYNHDGSPVTCFGRFGSEDGNFRRPTGIAYSSILNRVYVTDKDNHRVQVFYPDGEFVLSWGRRGKQAGAFAFPWGIDVNSTGDRVVVADSRNHRVQLFDENGHFLAKISDRGIYFDYPRAVTFDPTGLYVYISDFNLNHILRVDSKLQQSCTIVVDGHQLSRPQGLHIDATGQLFVSCAKADEIKVFDSWTGQPLYSLATLNDSTLDAPLNVASVNNNGHLAILEMNGKISII